MRQQPRSVCESRRRARGGIRTPASGASAGVAGCRTKALTRANAISCGRQVSCCTGLLRSFCDHGVTTSTSDDVWNPAKLDLRPIHSRGLGSMGDVQPRGDRLRQGCQSPEIILGDGWQGHLSVLPLDGSRLPVPIDSRSYLSHRILSRDGRAINHRHLCAPPGDRARLIPDRRTRIRTSIALGDSTRTEEWLRRVHRRSFRCPEPSR